MGAGYRGREPLRKRTERDRGVLQEMKQRERRRLVRLGLSAILFLVVYFGRGVLPQQVSVWRALLQGDMDISRSVVLLQQVVRAGDSPVQWLAGIQQLLLGGAELPVSGQGQDLSQWLFDYHERPSILELEGLQKVTIEQTLSAGGEEGAGVDEEPPIVTAMAQSHTEDGRALPANVSLQYYPLGLSETTLPVEGRVTSEFDFRDHPIREVYGFHTALDIGAPEGSEILAFAAGVVESVGENSVAGLYIQLDHGKGVKSFYAHCSKILLKQGESVACGTPIALVGETGEATGPHLHFVLEKDGIRLNPALYLDVT